MKRALSVLPIALLLTAPSLLAQRNDGTSMQPIIERASAVVGVLEQKEMEVVRIEMDIVSGEVETQRTLYNKWTYGAIAVADDRVQDLDIFVYKQVDGEWTLVKKDDTEDATPAVVIKPESPALYKFVIRVHKYSEGFESAHYALVIYHE